MICKLTPAHKPGSSEFDCVDRFHLVCDSREASLLRYGSGAIDHRAIDAGFRRSGLSAVVC